MLTTLACALAVGFGLCNAASAILPRTTAARPDPVIYTPSHRPEPEHDAGAREGALTRAALPLVPLAERFGLPRTARRRDLELLGRDAAAHLAQKIATMLALAILGTALFVFLHACGILVPGGFLAAFAGVPALYGFTAPDNQIKAAAAAHRDQLRQVLVSFLTLASLALAAGGNINEALATASQAGHGPAADQLRGALAYAESSGAPAWDTLAELGRRADVPELTELAAAVRLTGSEGARLRATLSTKARALRERQLAAREAAELAATEKTALPTTLMMLGYLLLVAAPAAATAMHAL